MRFWILPVFAVLLYAIVPQARAAGYDVAHIDVSIESADAVKARDLAITRAQRIAFAQLTGQSEEAIQKIGDSDIARLVSGFSVRSERLTAHSYRADFTVRFEPYKTQNYIDRNGLMLAERDENASVVVQTPATSNANAAISSATDTAAPLLQTVVILPVLDIGSRRVVWDDPNPWREAWQKKNHSTSRLKVTMPLADASDIVDIPDAAFLNSSGKADVANLLSRYGAQELYIVVAKNQGAALDPSGGMAVSLYKHDGKQLTFVRKNVIRARPGYVFDDAVPAGMQMVLQERGLLPVQAVASLPAPVSASNTAPQGSVTTLPVVADMSVTVPYQSLQQWVGIQQNLRRVSGVQNIVPVRISPSSAQVQLATNVSSEDLKRNLADHGFDLQTMPSGELVLIER